MNPSDFKTTKAGRAIRTTTGYWAFIPAPLPPAITYDAEMVVLLSQADAALSKLSGLGLFLPNPNLLIAPYMRREAVASSRIEGTQADLSDLMLDEIEPKRTPPGSDVSEVRNYVTALNTGMKRLKTLPLKQWAVGREFNRRMKKRFDELGIEIPFPHLTLYQGQDKKGKAPPLFVASEVAVKRPADDGDNGLHLAGAGEQRTPD